MSLLKSLQEQGHQIICIAPFDEFSDKLVEEGFEYIPIQMNAKSTNPFSDLKMVFEFNKVLAQVKPDVLLNYTIKPNIFGTLVASFYKTKIINNVSGLGTIFLRTGISVRLALLLYKIAFRYPEKVFFQNEYDRQLFINKGLVKPIITDVVPGSGVDLTKFSPNYILSGSEQIVFLMPARLLIDKGVYEFAAAARHLKQNHKNARFILVGATDYNSGFGVKKKDLEAWISDQIIEYHIFTQEIDLYLKMADCVVLPSYREGTSKALLEALAMGKPIITTDTPGCKETVDDTQNGFLCKVKDVQSLVLAMENFMALQAKERLDMGIKSREKAETQFDEKFVIHKYKKVIFGF